MARLSVSYLILNCLLLLISQFLFALLLWSHEGEDPTLFGSTVLYLTVWWSLHVLAVALLASAASGLALLAAFLIVRRSSEGHAMSVTCAVGGLVCACLVPISAALLEGWNWRYAPPPGLMQFGEIVVILIIDVAVALILWRQVRKHRYV